MNPFSILMFCFSGAILLYAGLLGISGNADLIPRVQAAKIKNPRAYAKMVARITAFVALAPLGSGIYALFSMALGVVMLVVDFILCIWIGTRLFWNGEC